MGALTTEERETIAAAIADSPQAQRELITARLRLSPPS